jgi:hypothetical protein
MRIGTEMKSVGEVMAIGRTFPEVIQRALRMLDIGVWGLDPEAFEFEDSPAPTARRSVGGNPGLRFGRCRAVIRLSRAPTRQTWRRGDRRHGSDGGSVSVSAPVTPLIVPLDRVMRGAQTGARKTVD